MSIQIIGVGRLWPGVFVLLLALLLPAPVAGQSSAGQSSAAAQRRAEQDAQPAQTLYGRIIDMFGVGVVAAHVRISPLDCPHIILAETRTDGDGVFRIANVAWCRRWHIHVSSKGLANQRSEVAAAALPILVRMVEAIRVRGVLHDGSGLPLAGVPVRGMVYQSSGDGNGVVAWVDENTQTRGDGTFELQALPRGELRVVAVAGLDGLAVHEETARGDVRCTLAPDAVVRGHAARGGSSLRISVDGLAPAEYRTLRLRIAQATATVVSPGDGAENRLVSATNGRFPDLPRFWHAAEFDAKGHALLTGLPRESFNVRVVAPGMAFEPPEFRTAASLDDQEVRFVRAQDIGMRPEVTLVVRCVDGSPCAQQELRVLPETGARAAPLVARTNKLGRVSFRSPVASGQTVRIAMVGDDYALAKRPVRRRFVLSYDYGNQSVSGLGDSGVVVRLRGTLPIELTPQRTLRVHGRLLDRDREPVGGVLLELRKVDASNGQLRACYGFAVSQPDGRYHFGGVVGGGRGVVAVAEPYGSGVSETVELQDGLVAVEALILERARRVLGVVRDAAGKPVAGVRVRYDSLAGGADEVWTDSAGRYCFVGCSPGRAHVTAAWQGGRVGRGDQDVVVVEEFGDTTVDLDAPQK
ncbi:MAG: carboxypeptidase-like regulatory domain-containing protein [Planctomycetota bacterium]